ncbi:hypothetical protein BD413DRAFT_613524 [Trametes elegans]|nr:hypothetical protein BD413DRAFT_613524 [Trametes elegans]
MVHSYYTAHGASPTGNHAFPLNFLDVDENADLRSSADTHWSHFPDMPSLSAHASAPHSWPAFEEQRLSEDEHGWGGAGPSGTVHPQQSAASVQDAQTGGGGYVYAATFDAYGGNISDGYLPPAAPMMDSDALYWAEFAPPVEPATQVDYTQPDPPAPSAGDDSAEFAKFFERCPVLLPPASFVTTGTPFPAPMDTSAAFRSPYPLSDDVGIDPTATALSLSPETWAGDVTVGPARTGRRKSARFAPFPSLPPSALASAPPAQAKTSTSVPPPTPRAAPGGRADRPRVRRDAKRRNVQVDSDESSPASTPASTPASISDAWSPASTSSTLPGARTLEDFKRAARELGYCLKCGPGKYRAMRVQDLVRHVHVHFKRTWKCRGLPRDGTKQDFDKVEHESKAHVYEGWHMIGGCNIAFSRKDSYARHLSKPGCIGDVNGMWHPANREAAALKARQGERGARAG